MAAVCLLASGLVALRYGMGHGLNLRAPITQLFFEDEAIKEAKKAQALYPKSKTWMDEAQSLLSKLGMAPNPQEARHRTIRTRSIRQSSRRCRIPPIRRPRVRKAEARAAKPVKPRLGIPPTTPPTATRSTTGSSRLITIRTGRKGPIQKTVSRVRNRIPGRTALRAARKVCFRG